MFKRRKKQTLLTKVKSWFWPTIGWNKYKQYLVLRLSRLGSTPYSIAAGVACGVAISFTPFVGFHFVLAAITAFLCRGNILASAIGTAMGNPWTFPFIWVSVYYTGKWFLGIGIDKHVSFMQTFEKGMHALMSFDFSNFATDVWPVIYPMMVGCIPYYVVSWLLSYYIVWHALNHINKKKKQKRNVI